MASRKEISRRDAFRLVFETSIVGTAMLLGVDCKLGGNNTEPKPTQPTGLTGDISPTSTETGKSVTASPAVEITTTPTAILKQPTEAPKAVVTSAPTPRPADEVSTASPTSVSTPTPTEAPPPPTPKPTPPPPPEVPTPKPEQVSNGIEFNYLDKSNSQFGDLVVLQADRDTIEKTAFFAKNYYDQQMGLSGGPITCNVLNVPSDFSPPITSGTFIRINTAQWPTKDITQRENITAHEYFHALVYVVSHVNGDKFGRFWIREGAAAYAGLKTVLEMRTISIDPYKSALLADLKKSPKLPPLNSIVNATPGLTTYLGILAVDFLVGVNGLRPLGDLVRNLKTNPPDAAFEKTFGESYDAFQTKFEKYRAENNI